MRARPAERSASSRRLVHARLSAGAVALAAVLAVGCGRQASEADCQLIIDRNVELQMKAMNINDPAAIQRKQEELRKEMKEELRGECVGRRVTDKMMECVTKAETTDAINECVR